MKYLTSLNCRAATLALATAALASLASAQTVGPITFTSGSMSLGVDSTNKLTRIGGVDYVVDAAGFAKLTSPTTTPFRNNAVWVYDSTPVLATSTSVTGAPYSTFDGTASITVSAKVSFSTASTSFGISFFDNGVNAFTGSLTNLNALTALFTINSGTGGPDAQDAIRVYRDASMANTFIGNQQTTGTSGSTGGTFGSPAGGATNSYYGDAGLTISANGSEVFSTLTAIYNPVASTLSISMGALNAVFAIAPGDLVGTTPSIAISARTQGLDAVTLSTVRWDDVSITDSSAIPEPSAYAALSGLGMLAFAATRRRRSV
jgi:hypothetical protein